MCVCLELRGSTGQAEQQESVRREAGCMCETQSRGKSKGKEQEKERKMATKERSSENVCV